VFEGFVQKPNVVQLREPTLGEFNGGLDVLSSTSNFRDSYPFIKKEQMLLFRQNPIDNNPQGDSPLMHCYDAWLEKKLVEKYEVVGVSKDLGGAIVLEVPSELINKANDPVNYPDEAAEYAALQDDAAALHAGESSYIVMSSDVDPITNQKLYDITLKGIDGGGKQYKTSDIIDQKRKSIYNVFGAGFLLLGQDSVGSYNLSSTATSTHAIYVQRNIMWKTDVINTQLLTTLLEVNNIHLDWEDMPVFEPADPDEMDLDIVSKAVQRMKSVGGLTPQAMKTMYERSGLPTEGISELTFDDGDTSRAGESKGSSGTGNTQSGGKSSATNSENGGSVAKNFIIDHETDDEYVAIDPTTGQVISINKEE
jgi:hypothetical protein